MIETIKNKDETLAIIIRNGFHKEGVSFFTPDDFSQQLAYMSHPSGKKIQAHVHQQIERKIFSTKEVLFIKKGKLKVDFFNYDQEYLESSILETGDVILLSEGGHGFEVLEDIQMFEVKQGPYVDSKDKIRF
jgi:hypothetical protein